MIYLLCINSKHNNKLRVKSTRCILTIYRRNYVFDILDKLHQYTLFWIQPLSVVQSWTFFVNCIHLSSPIPDFGQTSNPHRAFVDILKYRVSSRTDSASDLRGSSAPGLSGPFIWFQRVATGLKRAACLALGGGGGACNAFECGTWPYRGAEPDLRRRPMPGLRWTDDCS